MVRVSNVSAGIFSKRFVTQSAKEPGVTVNRCKSRVVRGKNGGDGEFRSGDPGGAFFAGIKRSCLIAPTVSVYSAQDLLPTLGQVSYVVFTSTQRGHWEIASDVYGATITESEDGLQALVAYTPTIAMTQYVAVRCVNAAGRGKVCCRQHPGLHGVKWVGPSQSSDFSSMTAAYAWLKAQQNPGGWAVIIEDGTYTNPNMFTYPTLNGDGANQPNQPPAGEWTEYDAGYHGDKTWTIQRFTCIVAETPGGVILDAQNARDHAIELVGDTSREWDERPLTDAQWMNRGETGSGSWYGVWSNSGLAYGFGGNYWTAGAARRGIVFMGLVAKNCISSGFHTYYVDHVMLEYCFCDDVSLGVANANNSGISFQNSLYCVASNCHAIGSARYKVTIYQSKYCIFRRCFGRFDYLTTKEPHGTFNFYRGRHCRADNCLAFDSDQMSVYNSTSGQNRSQEGGCFLIANTDVYSYPRDITYNRCLGFNNQLMTFLPDCRDVDPLVDGWFHLTDCGHWYHSGEAEGEMNFNGPGYVNRATLVNGDTSLVTGGAATPGFLAYRNQGYIVNSILMDFGYKEDGTNSTYLTNLFECGYDHQSPDNGLTYDVKIQVVSSDLYHNRYNNETAGYQASEITYNNVRTTFDPKLLGCRYPGRIEPDSYYKVVGRGQDDFFLAIGRRGTFWGDPNCTEETGQLWLNEAMLEWFLPLYRVSYTNVAKYGGGTGTVVGDRGGVTSTRMLIDYITSKKGKDVPFVSGVTASKVSASATRMSLRLVAPAYMTNITGYELYMDGDLAETLGPEDHSVDLIDLISGASYSATFVAIDSVFGRSGPSYPVTVTA